MLAAGATQAAGGDLSETAKQVTNWTAIAMFGSFVAGTLWVTKLAEAKAKSAAFFLDISAAVVASGYDGLVYPHLIPGRLADHHLPDGRAPA